MTVTPDIHSIVTVIETKVEQNPPSGIICWCSSNWKKLISELVATFLLLFLGCAACIPIDGFHPMPPMYAGFTFAFVVTVNIQIFGHISGAHMNPSITILAILWGKMSIALGICYVIAQCIGSILASWVLMNVSPVDFVAEAVCVTRPHVRLDEWQAIVVEVVLTATLCLITCGLWDPVNEKRQDSAAIKFGIAIAGLSFAGGPLTGASMNSARTLGPAVVTGIWTSHWIYWVGPPLGAFIAAIYKILWLEKPK